jgi:hypothetical protein
MEEAVGTYEMESELFGRNAETRDASITDGESGEMIVPDGFEFLLNAAYHVTELTMHGVEIRRQELGLALDHHFNPSILEIPDVTGDRKGHGESSGGHPEPHPLDPTRIQDPSTLDPHDQDSHKTRNRHEGMAGMTNSV